MCNRTLLRLTALFAAAALAAVLCGCPQESAGKPVLPDVPRAPFTKPWTDRPVFLIGLGDSITAGYGASPGRSYFDLLVNGSPDDPPEMNGVNLKSVLPRLKAVNLSMSATVSAEHLAQQVPRMGAFDKDTLGIVVITTGGNDVIHDYGASPPRDGAMFGATAAQAKPWVWAYEERLWKIIDACEAVFPGGCHIFLANIYDPTDDAGDIENAGLGLPAWPDGLSVLKSINAVIARCANERESVRLVDIRTPFLGHGIHHLDKRSPFYRVDDRSYWYFDNLEDPNDAGYDAIRRLFLREMATAIAPM
jgi:lysophospholipase L1-like esterase